MKWGPVGASSCARFVVVKAPNAKGPLSWVTIRIGPPELRKAVEEAILRLPSDALRIPSLTAISLRESSEGGSLAGLTTWTTYERRILFGPLKGKDDVVVQRIELYRDIIDQLSERARVAVVAHELAHAWLNDNVAPEASKEREKASDELARKWGFGRELDALAEETY